MRIVDNRIVWEGPDIQRASQIISALRMYAGTLPEDKAREVATVYPRYEAGTSYRAGQYITDGEDANGDPLLYKVVQDHTSQEDWPPADNPALYTCLSLDPGGYPIWSQPTCAEDAYNTGDIVSRNGTLYKSKIDGNTTEPGTDDRWWETVSKSDT